MKTKGRMPTGTTAKLPMASFFSRWGASTERTRLALIWILALGCAVRLNHYWAISQTAFLKITFVSTNSDPYASWQWAQTILAGDLLGRDTYHPYFTWMEEMAPLETWYRWWGGKEIFQQAPLYPYFVAGLLALSRNSLNFVILIQLLIGAFQPLVMFWLARRLFDDRVGLLAAGMTALYGPFVFHQGTLLRDWPPLLLEPLALVALLRARSTGRVTGGLLGGALIGIATLARETSLFLLPMAILWFVWEHRERVKAAGSLIAGLLLGFLLAMSPLIGRNVAVGAPLFAFSNRAAENLIEGNVADTFPVGLHHPLSMKGILERSDGRPLAVMREIWRTYDGDWLRFAGMQILKLRGLVDPLEVPNNVGFIYGLEISPVLRFTLRYGAIFPLGLAGFVLSRRAWRQHLLLILYGVVTIGGLMITMIMGRLRLVLVPLLIVYAAVLLVRLFQAARNRQTAKVMTYLGLLLGIAVVQHILIPFHELRDVPYYALHHSDYYISARIYASEGRPDRAVAELERLQAKARQRPGFARQVYETTLYEGGYRSQWAEQLIKEGKREDARLQAELAQAAYANHLTQSAPYFTLGSLYLKLGEPAKARAFFERFLELEPDGPEAETVRRILSGQARPPR